MIKRITLLPLSLLTLLVVCSFQSDPELSEMVEFDVFYKQKTIGNLHVNHTHYMDHNTYAIKSKIDFKILLLHIKVDYNSTTNNVEGRLEKAHVSTIRNDAKPVNTYTTCTDNTCMYLKEKTELKLPPILPVSTNTLYFSKPNDGDQYYREAVGKIATIHKIDAHTFTSVCSGEPDQTYTYDDNGIKEVEIEYSIYTLVFKRK